LGLGVKRLLLTSLKVYVVIGLAYAFWAFALLSIGECGLTGINCLPPGPRAFAVAMYALAIAAARGALWLPNLLVAIGQGKFLDWLFLRDAPPLDLFLNSN
jgi:hypothetical protein